MATPTIIDIIEGGTTPYGDVAANPWKDRARAGSGEIVGIVFHHTGPGQLDRIVGGKYGATYYIDTDGAIYQRYPDAARAYQIEKPSSRARTDLGKSTSGLTNSNTIGIEIVAPDSEHMTEAQKSAAVALGSYLAGKYSIDPHNIVGHGDLQGGPRIVDANGNIIRQGNRMTTEGVDVARMTRDSMAGVLPPMNIPTVASELDVAAPVMPRRRPEELAVMRAQVSARAKVLASSAMYGVRAPGGTGTPLSNLDDVLPLDVTSTDNAAYSVLAWGLGALPDERTAALIGGNRFDPVGEGPVSWFGEPDVAPGGIGSLAVTHAGAVLDAPAPAPAVPVRPMASLEARDERLAAQAAAPPAAPGKGDRLRTDYNSRDRLAAMVHAVYSGILPAAGADTGDLHGGGGSPAAALAAAGGVSLRAGTALPASSVGRWEIDPAAISRNPSISLTAPKLDTTLAFDPAPLSLGGLDGTRYGDMAAAFEQHFTVPEQLRGPAWSGGWGSSAPVINPAVRSVPPKSDLKLIGSPAWREWEASLPKAKPAAVRAPTVDETRKEQRQPPAVVSKPATQTVKAPEPIKAPAAPVSTGVAARAPIYAGAISTAPSAKPAQKVIKVENPEYVKWAAAQKVNPVAVGKLQDIHDLRDDATMKAQTSAVAPTVPPPPRYITKRVSVTAPQQKAPAGSYVIQSGDTLSSISRRTGISVAELARMNGITDPNRIAAGATLKVGGSNSIPVSAPSPKSNSAQAAAIAGAKTGSAKASSSGGGTFEGSATHKTYVVGQVYMNSQGVPKMAMADGTFQTVH